MELSEIQLGATEFSSVAFGNIELSGEGGSGVQDILAKMPAELRSALVCWYSPNLQGMTNKQLYDAMLVGEYPILRDLSGNGYDMELHGFDGTSASGVDGDGNLVFDGMNDYGVHDFTSKIDVSRTTYIVSYKMYSGLYASAFMSYDDATRESMSVAYGGSNAQVANHGTTKTSTNTDVFGIDNINIMCNGVSRDDILGTINIPSGSVKTISQLLLFKSQTNRHGNGILYSYIIFDRPITADEEYWVRNNMLVSQEPKKFVVNLWHYNNGEPILLGTRRVNNGSEIGELPSYDISATECTNEWYYDLTLSEDALVYDDDYVESDLNLYCSTMPIYERILDELDGVVLEDGTTAREHLVCMYSPKLQGMTKESVLADATLADLSGNGYDMTLYGFTEDEQIIDNDGALVFDGVDDWAMRNDNDKPILTDFTFIVNRNIHNIQTGRAAVYESVPIKFERVYSDKPLTYHTLRSLGTYSDISNCSNVGTSVMTKEKYNDITIPSGTSSDIQQWGNIAYESGYIKMDLFLFMILNKSLTDSEINRVKQILKL